LISVRGLTAKYRLGRDTFTALDGIDLHIEPGQVFVLLGPSGCGKTTLLRCLAGLERPTSGQIEIEGAPLSDAETGLFIPPEDRPLAMVFQSYAMWPHMTVFDNVAFPLKAGRRRVPPHEVSDRVTEVLTLLGIDHLADRSVTTLSGGQQQRVGLARALALRPRVLLMDEPLSNLDFRLQVELRGQLRTLMHDLDLTTVHVTHNQAEALEMGDRIAVMDAGHVVQIGDPESIYHRPVDEHVARFVGDMNLIPGSVARWSDGTAQVLTASGTFLAMTADDTALSEGSRCFLGIRPADLVVPAPESASPETCMTVEIVDRRFQGDRMVFGLKAGDTTLEVSTHHSVRLGIGSTIQIQIPPDSAIAVIPTPENRAHGVTTI
jgi:iron(III) transport system ATP-binding protein